MGRACKTDDNQQEIIERFRGWGATVKSTHMVGNGFPDLVVGFQGVNLLVEVKDGSKPPSRRKLTKDQQEFHKAWGGKIYVVATKGEVDRLCLGLIVSYRAGESGTAR